MTRLITFTDDNMTIAADICVQSAKQNNVHETKIYRPKDIDAKFYKANKAILDAPRAGYWLWKPYFIDRELKKMNEGDYLIYCDAGVEIVNNVNHIIDRMDQDIFLFANQYKHVEWSKGAVLDAIIPEWRDGRYDSFNQVQASVIVVRNSQISRGFINEWLKFCCVQHLIDDSPSITPNYKTFSENRHDQSCLCSLQIKYGVKLHYWSASYNNGAFVYPRGSSYQDTYPTPLFNHHRKRNNEWQEK